MKVLMIALTIAVAAPGVLAAVHLFVLTFASLFYRQPQDDGVATSRRFLVVIPAHNEAAVLEHTLIAVMAQMKPEDVVLVIADRCTDATADVARGAGAEVLERRAHEAPGKAAALAAGIEWAWGRAWDACVVLDADSIVEADFLAACDRALAGGAVALQARSEAELRSGLLANASLAAFALQGVAVPRGRDRLGLSVRLRGTGMVLARSVLERHPWAAVGASEDMRYSLDLCLDGILPRHVDSARLRSISAVDLHAATGQRVRWEAGRMLAGRDYLAPLVRHRTFASMEAAVHLVTPPFALAVASLTVGILIAVAAGWAVFASALTASMLMLAAALVIAMWTARVPASTWAALLAAPWYVAWKTLVQGRAILRLREARKAWAPTPHVGDRGSR